VSDPADYEDEEDFAPLQDEIQAALSAIFGKRGGAFVTNYVVLAATVETDGSQATWAVEAKDQRRWQTVGLLHYGLTSEAAEQLAERIE